MLYNHLRQPAGGDKVDPEDVAEAITLTWIGVGTAFVVLVSLAIIILASSRLIALPSRISDWRRSKPVEIPEGARDKALAASVAVSALLKARRGENDPTE